MAPASGDGTAAIRHRLADTEVAQTCREPMRCLPIEADGKTAKRLRDREISRLQSQSSFQKRTCLRSREGQSRKQTMKITYVLAALLLVPSLPTLPTTHVPTTKSRNRAHVDTPPTVGGRLQGY